MRADVIMRDVRYSFPPPERVRLAEDLSQDLIRRALAWKAFSAAKHQHEENVEKIEASIASLTRQLCEGWEYRDVRCRVLWNSPEIGQKTIVRLDTGEEFAVEPMTEEEMQEPLPLVRAGD